MNHPVTGDRPGIYRLRVAGHLDRHWSSWFGDLALTVDEDGTTSICGPVADQAQLHGLLAKIRDLGLTLVSVALVGAAEPAATRSGRPVPAAKVRRVHG